MCAAVLSSIALVGAGSLVNREVRLCWFLCDVCVFSRLVENF